jgi:hypothetical protein
MKIMGDRGIVKMVGEGQPSLNFYTHWGATDLPAVVAEALKRGKGRWDDESYLNRIVFSEMIQDDVLSETGYGIMVGDADYDAWRYVTINHDTKTVEVSDFQKSWSFDSFITAFANETV